MCIHFVDAFQNTLLEFVPRFDADVPQEAARHLGERGLHQIQPRAVLERVDVLETSGMLRQPSHRFLGDVRTVIVQHDTNARVFRVMLV